MRSIKFRRSYMTLLETIIAMFLLSIVLVFVFAFFRELTELAKLTEEAQKRSFQMRYVESRLAYIFERITNENQKNQRSFFFYTQKAQGEISDFPSLIFTFDNGVRLDPTFSGHVLARLYVDSKYQLCLAIWPMKVPDPWKYLHEEILLDGVSDIRFTFYSPIDPSDKNQAQKAAPEEKQWHDEWEMSYNQMPCIIKIHLKMQSKNNDLSKKKNYLEIPKELVYNFVLPSSKNLISL